MNNTRRKAINEVIEKISQIKTLLEEAQSDIQDILDEEQDYMYNIPENLQQSQRYEDADAAVRALDDALSYAQDAQDNLEGISSELDTAKYGG